MTITIVTYWQSEMWIHCLKDEFHESVFGKFWISRISWSPRVWIKILRELFTYTYSSISTRIYEFVQNSMVFCFLFDNLTTTNMKFSFQWNINIDFSLSSQSFEQNIFNWKFSRCEFIFGVRSLHLVMFWFHLWFKIHDS